ncbi:hypothetical protein Dsin_017327 [Dipteronia sinensis]|uniref:Uncharacterized protein n=1 Tax=Dipteronia sinensis TaxID=43782 RepID=A0AAE0AEQ9_9ROSI|nr:hypothetical protein Dsin_017327 [Dipteronia sinensis]
MPIIKPQGSAKPITNDMPNQGVSNRTKLEELSPIPITRLGSFHLPNTPTFEAINGRQNRNKILSIMREDGSLIEGDVPVKNEAIRHFQKILGCSIPSFNRAGTLQTIIHNHISNDQADLMSRSVTNEKIHDVFFSLHPNKAPGSDGFFFLRRAGSEWCQ